MKNILLKVILVCSILFSCSSKEDEIIDSETGNLINVSTNRQITRFFCKRFTFWRYF
ncbi:hypothetical protein OEG92_19695 [Polaribacter sejongensis]|uniref:hypothetical protein n=1 Tax=Polaribacter sejongensis TaxID=985043 RepID=UPI0035A5F5CF